MVNNQPIGVIDSGFGGLTVVKEMLKQLPNETIYFVGDSARCPYGVRSAKEIKQFTWEMVNFLLAKQIKLLVIACNTATAHALDELKDKLTIPVVGVIQPGARCANHVTQNNQIGVIATNSTIHSNVYENLLKSENNRLTVYNLACPTLVEIVEQNQMNDSNALIEIDTVLSPLKATQIDTLILGCTHYPHLKKQIQSVLGTHVQLVDSGVETVKDIAVLLDYFNLKASGSDNVKRHRFFTTKDKHYFETVSNQWLNLSQISVEEIILNKSNVTGEKYMKTLLIATKNIGKAKEFKQIFGEKGYDVKTLLDYPEIEEVEETGTTFEENARLKAETIAKQLNVMVLSDDSGLEVEALDGAPGVYSARYAGEPKNDARNVAKLLAELAELQVEGNTNRKANFHCTLVLAFPDKASIVAEGKLYGEIAHVPQGENGFGYDPVFFVPELNKTTAQLLPEEKNAISHRRQAINQLMEKVTLAGL